VTSLYRAVKLIHNSTEDCLVHLENDSEITHQTIREIIGAQLTAALFQEVKRDLIRLEEVRKRLVTFLEERSRKVPLKSSRTWDSIISGIAAVAKVGGLVLAIVYLFIN
jgi:chemotaxis regulatin CheY-phosphate phosphatase CheZ